MSDKTPTRSPLYWPDGWPRTIPAARERANFGKTATTYGSLKADNTRDIRKQKAQLNAADATARLENELERLGATDAILSTNLKLRLDGTPRSNEAEPFDVGAAVYFTLDKKPICFACDKWDRVADNIAAMAQHIDALRRIERYGVGRREQVFAGYTALPPVGGTAGGDWRVEFGFMTGEKPTLDIVEARYRSLLKSRHPDNGGSHDAVVRLNLARDSARAYFTEHA